MTMNDYSFHHYLYHRKRSPRSPDPEKDGSGSGGGGSGSSGSSGSGSSGSSGTEDDDLDSTLVDHCATTRGRHLTCTVRDPSAQGARTDRAPIALSAPTVHLRCSSTVGSQ
ncbi:hypothetical protein PV326_005867 [Microctonus aethiopoides]|nr:hypothetical protein PV326_005867 [Microctonus aethiopoides]